MKRSMITVMGVVAVLLAGTAQANTIEGQGVWLFDEGQGLTTADSSGNGNNGTLVNGPGWTTDTPFTYAGNHALSFDGTNDYVSVPDSASLDVTGAITVEAWLKPNTVSASADWRAVVYKLHASGTDKGGYGLIAETDQSAVYFFTESGGVAFAGADLTLDAWNHVAGTLDATGYMALYVNGVLKDSGIVGTAYLPHQTDRPLYIGGNPDNDGFAPYEFAGNIDEVRILSRALSAGEVLSDYQHSIVPEPGTLVLLAAGGLTALAAAWIRRRGER